MTTTDTRVPTVIDERREELRYELAVIDAVEAVAPFHDVADWRFNGFTYYEPWNASTTMTADERRSAALAWLADRSRALVAIAKHMGAPSTLTKVSTSTEFGVEVKLGDWPQPASKRIVAVVPASLTCEMVPTGEVEHIPAEVRPVMERRCPESIFAGIQNEVDV